MSASRPVWSVNAHPEIVAGMRRLDSYIAAWVAAGCPLTGEVYERKHRAYAAMGAIAHRLGYGWSRDHEQPWEEALAAEWPEEAV